MNSPTAHYHPTRSHELLPYREDSAETMADFFVRFERHCTAEYRGTMDDALPLLRSKLSGRMLDIFDANGPRSPYPVIKRRMLEWASRQRGYEESSAADAYRDAARRPGESLPVYAFRLAALFEDAYPEANKQVSNDLRRKLLSTLPTCAADFLRRQLRYALVNHDTALTWDGLVSFLECERFESGSEDTLYACASAEHTCRTAPRSHRSSRPLLTSPRPRPIYRGRSLSADASDSDSDCSRRSVGVSHGALQPRGASARQRREPGVVQPRSPAREHRTVSVRCDFCRRRGHTEKECRRANDLCFSCGASDHFARACPATHDGAIPPVSGHMHRPSSPRPLSKPQRDSSIPAANKKECGGSRPHRRGRRNSAHSRPEN